MKTKKKQIFDLWKAAFGDSNKFMKMYFERVYRDEYAMVIEDNKHVLSSLLMLPYTMMFCGEEISVAYISGACTLPSEKGKGLMKQLLQHSFAEMRERDIALTALIPAEKWLFNYYRSQGYTEVFEYSLKVYTHHEYIEPERDLQVVQQDENLTEEVFAYFDRKLRERPACILHTYDGLVTILKDIKISKGKCMVAYNPRKEPVGLAFVLPPDKQKHPESVSVKEILYNDERVKKHLLFEITKQFKVPKAMYRIPYADSLVTFPYGMARVVDTERLIRLWAKAHPDSPVTVAAMREMNIQTLTSHLFDYGHKSAYMSLMLD